MKGEYLKMLNQNILDIIVKVYHFFIPIEVRKKMKPMLNRYVLRYILCENRALYRDIKASKKRGDMVGYEKECNYIQKYGLHCVPYSFIEEYLYMNVDVLYDDEEMKHYVMHNGKRLFYPRDYSVDRIIELYRQVRYEQDVRSPHFYWNSLNKPVQGDIFVDVGAAEGLVALDYIQEMSKVYIIECEERWVDALRATFKPYKEKAIIIPALCGEHVESRQSAITLDYLLGSETSPIVIKMDIEGGELKALRGASMVLKRSNTKLAVTTYHTNDAAKELYEYLDLLGYKCEWSNGYMLFVYDHNTKYPYFRRGILCASRIEEGIRKITD